MKQSRVKNSVYNAIMMIISTGISSILSLISTSLILKNYGSDFNGVVATATQIVNLLLIVEGGFSLAINVALFKPFIDNDTKEINVIMSTAKKTFFKIGSIFLIIGTILSFIYSFIVKSNLDFFTVFLIFMMVIVSSGFTLIFTIKYQIMFQVSQREYFYTAVGIVTNILSYITIFILLSYKVHMLLIRLSVLIFSILNGIIIYLLYKRIFKGINLNAKPDYSKVKGTKDVMAQKLTSVIYNSSPLLFTSTFIDTKMSSVYNVYVSIYNIIKLFITSIVAAPVNGFGQLLSDKKSDKKKVYRKFQIYEFIVIIITTILISSVLALILPFVKIYTAEITDINYVDKWLAIMIALVVALEVIHIPSGNIINVTSNFKVAKKFQIIVSLLLIVLLTTGGFCFGIYGILGATIITNSVLALLEIHYTHKKIFSSNIYYFFKIFFTNILLVIIIYFVSEKIIIINNYFDFFCNGIVVLIMSSTFILSVNYCLFNNIFKETIMILKKFLIKKY